MWATLTTALHTFERGDVRHQIGVLLLQTVQSTRQHGTASKEGYDAAAKLLVELTSVADAALGEVDYDRRLGAYKGLQDETAWLQFDWDQLPVLA